MVALISLHTSTCQEIAWKILCLGVWNLNKECLFSKDPGCLKKKAIPLPLTHPLGPNKKDNAVFQCRVLYFKSVMGSPNFVLSDAFSSTQGIRFVVVMHQIFKRCWIFDAFTSFTYECMELWIFNIILISQGLGLSQNKTDACIKIWFFSSLFSQK